jgi:hypothetical protein
VIVEARTRKRGSKGAKGVKPADEEIDNTNDSPADAVKGAMCRSSKPAL